MKSRNSYDMGKQSNLHLSGHHRNEKHKINIYFLLAPLLIHVFHGNLLHFIRMRKNFSVCLFSFKKTFYILLKYTMCSDTFAVLLQNVDSRSEYIKSGYEENHEFKMHTFREK